MPKSNRSYKSEKRRKELKRQQKKEKKLAKRQDKAEPNEQETIPGVEDHNEKE